MQTIEDYKREIRFSFELPEDGSLDEETMHLVTEFEKEQERKRKEEEERQKEAEHAQEQDDKAEENQTTNKPSVASAVRVVGNHDFVEDFDVERDDEELEGILT